MGLNLTDSSSPSLIAKSNVASIQEIFSDEKLAKQILGAAKRVTKKRSSDPQPDAGRKRTKLVPPVDETPASIEESLRLPHVLATETDLSSTILHTNRAPLVLAFAVTLLKYTMPDQPLSSRLSLAQAVVSANSRTKAVSLGLEAGKSAEEEGWGRGQPTVRVMGREIPVLKRWAYEWGEAREEGKESAQVATDPDGTTSGIQQTPQDPPLWGLDLESLRANNTRALLGSHPTSTRTSLPIHTAQSARAYLLKSFASAPSPAPTKPISTPAPSPSTPLKPTPTPKPAPNPKSYSPATREHNLALLLQALDWLLGSWAPPVLGPEELDRRCWGWYVAVRPEVRDGVAGWGGKGEVSLGEILALRSMK